MLAVGAPSTKPPAIRVRPSASVADAALTRASATAPAEAHVPPSCGDCPISPEPPAIRTAAKRYWTMRLLFSFTRTPGKQPPAWDGSDGSAKIRPAHPQFRQEMAELDSGLK